MCTIIIALKITVVVVLYIVLDEDYVLSSSPFVYTIGPDSNPHCPNVTIQDDSLLEGNQEFYVAIMSTNLNSEIISPQSLIRIIDNEGSFTNQFSDGIFLTTPIFFHSWKH